MRAGGVASFRTDSDSHGLDQLASGQKRELNQHHFEYLEYYSRDWPRMCPSMGVNEFWHYAGISLQFINAHRIDN